MRRLRAASFRLGDEVRKRHRLAELLYPARRCGRDDHRSDPPHDPHGSALPPVRWSSGTRVRRRPPPHRAALLHERRFADLLSGAVALALAEGPRGGEGDAIPLCKLDEAGVVFRVDRDPIPSLLCGVLGLRLTGIEDRAGRAGDEWRAGELVQEPLEPGLEGRRLTAAPRPDPTAALS